METGFEQYSKSMKKFLTVLDANMGKLMNRAGIEMVETTRTLQDDNNNYATRNLSNKTNYKVKGNTLTFGSNATSKGYAYGLVQEFGRKKGTWPNIGAIEKWVKKKIMLGHMTIKDPRKLGKNRSAQIETLAFLIARKIKDSGTKGRFSYKIGFERGARIFNKELEIVILKAFNE